MAADGPTYSKGECQMSTTVNSINGPAADETLRWVTFRLENEKYGINVMQVQEVLRVTEIAPVPGAPSYVLGIINLRGNVVTVIDTRMRFGLMPKEMDDSTRIVIIESDDQVVGILVDSVAEVVDLSTLEIETAPNVGTEESGKFIQGVASHDNELLILVDLNKLLTDEEWANTNVF
jgi:purine-binding chemotaxis protein CheW